MIKCHISINKVFHRIDLVTKPHNYQTTSRNEEGQDTEIKFYKVMAIPVGSDNGSERCLVTSRR